MRVLLINGHPRRNSLSDSLANAYAEGALDTRSKELIGLTCSLVLRCDDCVRYHRGKCREIGFTTEQINEAMGIATLVGGTIVIPHLRRAFEYWEELQHV